MRTYARRGQTPLLRVPLTREHLAVISALSEGQLVLAVQRRAYRGADIVRFLRQVVRHHTGKLLILWDSAPIHRAKEVRAFLAAGRAGRIQLEPLPSYAPELNPDERVWHQLKQVELGNVCAHDLSELER